MRRKLLACAMIIAFAITAAHYLYQLNQKVNSFHHENKANTDGNHLH